MHVVTGRCVGLPVDERKCTLCRLDEIGDEFHYLLKCTHFNELRMKYVKRYHHYHPNVNKLEKLFNESYNKEMLNISKFNCLILQQFK